MLCSARPPTCLRRHDACQGSVALPSSSASRVTLGKPLRGSRRSLTRRARQIDLSISAASTVSYGVASSKGAGDDQGDPERAFEDAHDAREAKDGSRFFGVYDGRRGADVSQFLAASLGKAVVEKLDSGAGARAAFETTFPKLDQEALNYQPPGFFGMFAARGMGGANCASCALTAVVSDSDTTKVSVGNVGDSRGVLVSATGAVQQLTQDHVGTDEAEQQRIQKCVLRTYQMKEDASSRIMKSDPARFFSYGDACVQPGFTWQLLQAGTSFPVGSPVTRSFGDAFLSGSDQLPEGYGMTAVPAVAEAELPPGTSWLVLASGSVWGALTNEEAAAICKEADGAEAAAKAVLAGARAKGCDRDATVLVAAVTV